MNGVSKKGKRLHVLARSGRKQKGPGGAPPEPSNEFSGKFSPLKSPGGIQLRFVKKGGTIRAKERITNWILAGKEMVSRRFFPSSLPFRIDEPLK
jgi:hypothetical protein